MSTQSLLPIQLNLMLELSPVRKLYALTHLCFFTVKITNYRASYMIYMTVHQLVLRFSIFEKMPIFSLKALLRLSRCTLLSLVFCRQI